MRVDAYGEIGNNIGQSRSVGGARGNANRVWARINTDNGGGSDCTLRVSAEVTGDRSAGGKIRKTCWSCRRKWESWAEWVCPECGADRQGRDTRTTHFEVGLPEDNPSCTVVISVGNPALRQVAEMGAFLCGIKGAIDCVNGEPERGKATIKTAAKILGELETHARENLPNVVLPGGVSMAHALACVEIVQDLIGGKAKEN